MSEYITQKKIIFPGSQILNNNLSDVNEKYFVYCSLYSAFIFNKSDFTLKGILGDIKDNYISAISLNKSNIDILALYYNTDILIYNLITCKFAYSFTFFGIKQMNFNKDSLLLILNNNGELYVAKADYTRFIYMNKINIDDDICNYFKWYPYSNDEFVYSTNKNKVYYYSISKDNNIDNNTLIDNIKNKLKRKYIYIKDEGNYSISCMEFYDLDANYKYLLVGTTKSKIFLVDFKTYEINMEYNKYGKTSIQYLFWLNKQPGSFISINEKNGKFIKWNVSKPSFFSIGKICDYNISSLVKFDGESNFLITNSNGDVEILNIINNKIIFEIKEAHNQSILDLKINPNNEDLFITACFDGNIRLYSIRENYKLIHIFNVNSHINNIKKIPVNDDNPRLIRYFNIKNNNMNYITSLVWSPKHKNFFASGDSSLSLRIYDITNNKQICLYQCPINKDNNNYNNITIQGIDWNEFDNILVNLNMNILLFSFIINENEKNIKNKFSLILVTELKLKNFVYNPIFESHNEYIITPCEDGKIYFFSTINDKLGRIIDINSFPSKEIKGHNKRINNITFNKSKKILASASDDMRIGLYNEIKTNETPMSTISHNFQKFLTGQESPINQVLFLNDNTLLSGSKNGVICIWDIAKLQLIHKIIEHINDIFCINSFNKYPSLFITSGKDCSVRFWNFNYNIDLEKLVKIKRNNKEEIEEFIRNNYFEEDLDIFFNLLNNSKKEQKLVGNYFQKKEYLNKEYSKFDLNNKESGIKHKIDFSVKKENKDIIIDKLIKESAIIQEWNIFCELCILRNKWEDAICFAPKVSLDYWQELMNRYENYINSEDYTKNINSKENHDLNMQFNIEEKEIISLLNGNNYKKVIQSCIKKKEFQDALMIWLVQKSSEKEEIINKDNKEYSNKKENKNNDFIKVKSDKIPPKASNDLMDIKIDNIYNQIKLNLKIDDIKAIIDEESLKYLKEGKRIKSIINYMYIDDKNTMIKILYKTNFIELGYLLCTLNDFDNKELNDINDFLVISLYEKYKNIMNDNIISQLINNLHDIDYKYIFYQILPKQKNKETIDLNKLGNKSELINFIEKKDLSSLQKIINKYKEECFNKIIEIFFDIDKKININEGEITNISLKLSEFIKLLFLLKIKNLELNKDLQKDIILCIMTIECLNYNYKALICLFIEYFITRDIFDYTQENNISMYKFIFNYINHVSINFIKNKIVSQYKFNDVIQQKYNSISSSFNNNLINFENFERIRKIMKFNDFYKCNITEKKFFYLSDEIYPKKVKKDDNLSSFSNTNIKSDIIKLESGNFASLSEYLEMSKFINIKYI